MCIRSPFDPLRTNGMVLLVMKGEETLYALPAITGTLAISRGTITGRNSTLALKRRNNGPVILDN